MDRKRAKIPEKSDAGFHSISASFTTPNKSPICPPVDEHVAIVGKPRIIPISGSISGNGNNAEYTIVKWVGIRLIEVHMTGDNKHVYIQPAKVMTRGGIRTRKTADP